jgi:nucleotide-binding universal stress UspA family protein
MPTDGSDHSERAVERGIELARLCGAKVTGIHVVPDYLQFTAFEGGMDAALEVKVQDEAYRNAAKFLAFVQQTADAAGVPCDTVVATDAHAYDAIVNTANERGCDLIVMTARHRTGLASLLMRNEASRVLHRASIPVLTFRALISADHADKAPTKS